MELSIKQTTALDQLEDKTTNEILFGGGAGGGQPAGSASDGGGGSSGNGTVNTGGGGGAGNANLANGGAGGSGVVILRMPTASYSSTTTGSPTVTTDGTDTILVFNASGSYTG